MAILRVSQAFIGRAACIGILVAGGCTFLVGDDGNSKRCDPDRACPAGSSCLGNYCFADHSVGMDETCTKDQQCPLDAVCSSTPHYACRIPCTSFFERTSSECAGGEYCVPYPILPENADSACTSADCTPAAGKALPLRGACARSECNVDADCAGWASDLRVCVGMRDGVSACLPGCGVTWQAGLYSDDCGSTASAAYYCQPVGKAPQRLACLFTSATAQAEGAPCSPVLQPCLIGLACIDSVCRRHCDPSAPSCTGPGQQCVAHAGSTGADTFNVCQ